MSDDRKLAMFIDFENIVRGVKEAQYKQFEIKLVLERLVEKGKIMVKRAYADWNRYAEYKRPFHEHAIELIDVPQSRYSGKNSADIRMVVDAMDLAYAKQHVDSFALVSGDSDFSPLVSKLRENDRYVIGLGVKSSSSELLVGNCDEFIFYEDLIRESKKTTALRGLPEKKMEAMAQLIEAIQALQRENKDTLWGSMVKQTMQRKNPAFNESYYGYSTFSKLLEEAAKQKIVTLERDARSGTYIITSVEDGRAQVTGGDDQEGGDALGRDVPGHHARLGGSQHPGRFHVRELFDGQHHRPDDAAAQGHPRDRDGHDDRCQPGPQTGHEQQGQDEGGQRHQDVEDALTDQVRPSAEVATRHTPDESDAVAEQHRADGHEQDAARAEDDPAQHVAPEMVGAQDVPGQRRIANHAVVRGQRVVGRQPVGQHGHRRQQQQQQGADAAER